MARAALDWSIKALAEASTVGSATVSRFERGDAEPIPATLAAIQRAFEASGIRFTERGVELEEEKPEDDR